MYSPEELYDLIGFSSIERMIEYGRSIGKNYEGFNVPGVGINMHNIHHAHMAIFNETMENKIQRRKKFFPERDPIVQPVKPPNPKITTFAFILQIGPSTNSFKINDYVFTVTNLNLLKPSQNNTNLQITALLESEQYHDQIYTIIRWYRFENDNIRLSTNTVRTSNEGWGLHVKAHLLLNVFEENVPSIP
jgi:hypothetical protein